MKKAFYFMLAIAALTATVCAQTSSTTRTEKQYEVYGVAFYNLENLFDTINNNGNYDKEYSPSGKNQWNSEKYYNKLHNLAYAISEMKTAITTIGPAVLGVAEVENRSVLEDLVKQPEIADRHYQIVHHDSPDRRGIDVSLLYNPRLFQLLNVTNTPLVVESNPNLRTRDVMCVTGMMGGEKVSILVNHWPSRLGGQEQSSYLREAAAALNKHLADSLLADDPNQGIIIMGDLNDDPQNKSCAKVLGAKKDRNDVKKGGFYNPWWTKLDKGIGTLAYNGNWNLFDQIIISDYFLGKDASKLQFFRSDVLNKEFLKTAEGTRQGYPLRTFASGVYLNGYSDHYPTQIYLKKEARK